MTLEPIKDLVREHCGLAFGEGREPLLAEAVRTRLEKRGLPSREAYRELLSREPDEVRKLVSLITVGETYFFREPAHFKLLVERLIPELWEHRGDRGSLKIVCVGCSTGEEPYTVAIALQERFGPGFGSRFAVLGCDIDEEALAAARQGWYTAHSFRGLPERIREEYFAAGGGRHRIARACRDAVTFLGLNICGESFPDAVRGADVVFYRNVSIYFPSDIQRRVFRNLAGLLNEKGYLFLSSTETFCHDIGVLSLVELDGVFVYGKGVSVPIAERRAPATGRSAAAPRPAPAAARPGAVAVRAAPDGRSREEPHRIFDAALQLAQAKDYGAALERVEQALALAPGFAKAALLKTAILVNRGRLEEAAATCRALVERDRWCLEGQLFLGLIAKIRGDLAAARQRFKEALYIRSSCWIAHFHLAEIHRAEGDPERAGREFMIVIELLEGKDAVDPGLEFFTFSHPTDQIVHLCRHNLAALQSQVR